MTLATGEIIDTLHALRERKRSLAKSLADTEKEFDALSEQLLIDFELHKTTQSRGSRASASKSETKRAEVKDWDAFNQYVLDSEAPFLFQRRILSNAVIELIDSGENIPGVAITPITKINLRTL